MKLKIIQKIIYRIIILNIFGLNFLPFEPTFTKENFAPPGEDYLRQYEYSDEYIIGPGDSLFIKVSEDIEEMDMNIKIDGEGFAFLKRLKRVYVSGLTLPELTNILNKEYKKYVYEPEVEITIKRYRPIKVLVKGEVKSPGLHILPGSGSPLGNFENFDSDSDSDSENIDGENIGSNLENVGNEYTSIFFPTVIDALRKSGGLKTNSDLSKIRIIRKNTLSNGGGRKQTNINIINSQNNDLNFQNNIRIFDGDQIIISKSNKPILNQLSLAISSNINPKFLNIYVGGKVEQPGKIMINSGSSLNEALFLSGGKKILSGGVIFTRYNSDGSLERRNIRYRRSANPGSYNNPYLENGDIIFVGKSTLNYASEILTEITQPFTSAVTAYGTYKIISGN